MMRLLARAYLVIVGAAAPWAWYIDINLRNDPSEHMLPDMLLGIASWPTSAAMFYAFEVVPQIADWTFSGLIVLTLCAVSAVALTTRPVETTGRIRAISGPLARGRSKYVCTTEYERPQRVGISLLTAWRGVGNKGRSPNTKLSEPHHDPTEFINLRRPGGFPSCQFTQYPIGRDR